MTRLLHAIAVIWIAGTSVALADNAPDARIDAVAVSPTAPRLVMTLSESTVEVAGDVASASHARVLSRLVGEHFPGRAIDANLEPALVADVHWQVLTLSTVFVLAETSAGRLVLAPDSLQLNGIVDGETDLLETRVARVTSAAGPGFSSRISLHDLDRMLTTAAACSRMFDALSKDGIRFQFGTTELRPAAHAVLDRYVEYALDCPDVRLSISGHTDSSGDEALNIYLSDARAQAVRKYLLTAGIDAERVTAAGKGSAEPVADNATAWGRSRNRRIELELSP